MKRLLVCALAAGVVVLVGCKEKGKPKPKSVVQLPRKAGELPPIVKDARDAFERREYDKVISLLQGSVTDKKATPEHFYFLAMAYMNTARLPECEDTLKRGAERFPGYQVIREGTAYYQYVIGRLRLEEGDLESAHAAFGEALDQLRDDASFREKVATGYREGAKRLVELGQAPLAVQALEKARGLLTAEAPLEKALEEARAAAAAQKGGAKPVAKADSDAALKRIIAEPGAGTGGAGSVVTGAAPTSAPVASVAAPAPVATPSPSTSPPAPLANAAPPGTLDEARKALEQRDSARAASLARLVLSTNAEEPEALFILARALDRQGKAREAIAPVNAYLQAHPDDARLTLEMVRLKVSMLDSPAAEGLADKLLARKDLPADDQLAALHWKAIARLQAGNPAGAEQVLGDALGRNPAYPPALFVKGQIEEKKKNYKEAIALFEKATATDRSDPERPRYLFRLGLVYRQTGQDELATKTFQQLIAEDPSGPWAKKARAFAPDPVAPGVASASVAPTAAPAPVASRAPEPAPARPEGTAGQAAEKLDGLKAAVDAKPDDAGARVAYGDALEKVGRGGEAREEFARAAELAPAREDVQLKLGTSWFFAKDLPKATEAFRRALELNPKNARTYFNLGDILHARKDFQAEKELFEKLLAQNLSEKTNQQAKLMLRRLESPTAKR